MVRGLPKTPKHTISTSEALFLAKRTRDDFKRAIHYFNQAIAKIPTTRWPMQGLPKSYVLQPHYSSEPGSEVFPKARSAAEKALALDSNLADAHVSYGLVLLYADLDWAGAKRELERAIELNSNSATAHYFFRIRGPCRVGSV